MFRVTTPEITIALKNTDIDLDAAQQIEVTIKQRNLTITKTKTDLSMNGDLRTVSFTLTQEETQKLSVGTASIQMRVKTEGGQVLTHMPIPCEVNQSLSEEIL